MTIQTSYGDLGIPQILELWGEIPKPDGADLESIRFLKNKGSSLVDPDDGSTWLRLDTEGTDYHPSIKAMVKFIGLAYELIPKMALSLGNGEAGNFNVESKMMYSGIINEMYMVLSNFGRHLDGCDLLDENYSSMDSEVVCTCGWDQALDEYKTNMKRLLKEMLHL